MFKIPARDCSLLNPCTHCAPLSKDDGKKCKKSSSATKGSKGDLVKGGGGGDKTGKVCPVVPPSPDTRSPGSSRLEALEAGLFLFLFKSEIASMFSNLTGQLTASRRPVFPCLWGSIGLCPQRPPLYGGPGNSLRSGTLAGI